LLLIDNIHIVTKVYNKTETPKYIQENYGSPVKPCVRKRASSSQYTIGNTK